MIRWFLALLLFYISFIGYGRYKVVSYILENSIPCRVSPLDQIQASLELKNSTVSELSLLSTLASETDDLKRKMVAIKICEIRGINTNRRTMTFTNWLSLPVISERMFDELTFELQNGTPWEKLAIEGKFQIENF